jgi:hypothetical protein
MKTKLPERLKYDYFRPCCAFREQMYLLIVTTERQQSEIQRVISGFRQEVAGKCRSSGLLRSE